MSSLNRVDLPGLIGDEPLGFLAAVGLMDQLMETSYLCWDRQDRHAILYCRRHSSVADLVDHLTRQLDRIEHGAAIPHTSGFPVRRRRGAPDPLRVRPADYRSLLERVSRSSGGRHWLEATVTERATDEDGFCVVNPLVAVRGRQTLGSFWYYPMRDVRQDPRRLLTEALTSWRRVDGSEGWLLDHRASYSTHPGLRGPGGSGAVPGATWLATLAVTTFGYRRRNGVEAGRPVLPNGWFRLGAEDVFLWPLWTLPASSNVLSAVWNVGWASDAWKLDRERDGTLRASIGTTHGVPAPNSIDHAVDLGIFTMCAAVRHGTQGPLTPVPTATLRRADEWSSYPAWAGWDWRYPDVGDYPGKYGWG
ncbi:type I-G CRISPR-associated protein, Cas3-extension family [Micromonospora sagamiensis]|uniref:type I-G CRISPR-associated protein, Cas3-extension family n=1 Tax=Micromonospora sagamiensis TaxID=47875 RepID=UPI0011A8112B|nr:hypothetical protein [Micromonospora sagamiensis]